MESSPFGRLERVDLRRAWTREDTEFTPWLALPENLKLLGGSIGIELELVAQEQDVGPFRADLLCKDTADGSLVLIENQIERTDHSHLGQVITYAAGLDAVTVVWIAARFTEEHRAALDWLNEVSHEKIRFFGLEVELWRIGQSPVAPKFNMVAQPNDWTKAAREATGGASEEHQRFRQEFWTAFCAYLDRKGGPLAGRRTSSKDHWMTWGIGRSTFHLMGAVGFRDGWVSAALVVLDAEAYQDLRAKSGEIEAELKEPREPLQWDFDETRKQNYVQWRREGVAPMDRSRWPELHEWLRVRLDALNAVFRGRVAKL